MLCERILRVGAEKPNDRHRLRTRRQRPRRRAREKRDELAPPHSTTSSARASSAGPFHSITGLDRLWSWLVGLRDLKMRDIIKGTAYEKCLQHATFLGIDLVRAIKAVVASQPFHRRRGREHPIGLTCCLEARGDVDGIAPNVISELARANDPCHHRTGM